MASPTNAVGNYERYAPNYDRHALPRGFTWVLCKYNSIIQAVRYTLLLYQLLKDHGDTCEGKIDIITSEL